MKDTHQSFCRAIMSNSFQGLRACVSPITSTPATANPWFKRPSTYPFKGSPQRDKATNWDPPATDDHGIIRIGDAPCDTQGATEPEGVATPGGGNPTEIDSSFSEVTPQRSGQTSPSRPVQTDLPSDSQSGSPLLRTKTTPGRTWRASSLELATLEAGDVASGGHRVPHLLLQMSSHDACDEDHPLRVAEGNQDESIPESNISHRNLLLPGSGVAAKHWQTEGESLIWSPKKHSNLSEMERQRGPIKKRHYQPDVLDLSTKRANPETDTQATQSESVAAAREMFQEQLRLSPKQEQTRSWNTGSHADANPSPSERVLLAQELFQERLSMALKQEREQSTNEEAKRGDISASQTGQGVLSMRGETDRKPSFAEVTNFDQKPPVSIRSNQLLNQTSTNVTNSYSTGNLLVPMLPSTELVRQWVLHVTQSNGMFAMQHLQAKLAPDSESNRSPGASDVGRRGSASSFPTFKSPGRRGPTSLNAALHHQKPYACEHCSSRFKHRHHVIRHMRAHNGERPFHCEHCGATFARKCVLTNHRRTHTGEKPYICSECGDTFSRKHHLVIHQRTHSGEKPYQCLDCGAAFARSHHVNRHRKTHEKEHEIDAQIERLNSAVTGDANLHQPTPVPATTPSVLTSPKSDPVVQNADIKFYLPEAENTASSMTNSTTVRIPKTEENVCNIHKSATRASPSDIKL